MLKEERLKRKWTLAYVAKKTGVTISLIQKLENSKRKPSYDVLVKLLDLGYNDPRELFAEAPEPPNSRKE